MAKTRRRVVNGPAVFKGIVCRYWFFPPENTSAALLFTLSGKKQLFAHIQGMFPITHHGREPEDVLLIGSCANGIIGMEKFVMLYNERTRHGLVEPLDLNNPSSLLNTYFPELMAKPKDENPPKVMDFLRNGERERKISLLQAFFEALVASDPKLLACTKPIVNILLRETRELTEDVWLQTPNLGAPPRGDDQESTPPERIIFYRLDTVCREMNAFLRDIGLPGYMQTGIGVGGLGHFFFVLSGAACTTETRVVVLSHDDVLGK